MPTQPRYETTSGDACSDAFEHLADFLFTEHISVTSSTPTPRIQTQQSQSLEYIVVAKDAPAVHVVDVAEYVLRKLGEISAMKLQKLVYYCQVWSLIWDEKPLFYEDIEAWANGPIVRKLFNYHRGMFRLQHISTGNPDLLSSEEKETIDAVLNFYGSKDAQWLIELSRSEGPWQDMRSGLNKTDRSSRVIPHDKIAEYYTSL
jgi:uncharacterized phage-associated protein